MKQNDDIESLFRTHYGSMYCRAMLMLRDEDLARDVVHDVFESLLVRNLTDVTEAYLLKSVSFSCCNHLRRLSVRERIKRIYAVDEQEIAEEEWYDEETLDQIRSIVANDLSEACRKAVNLRFKEGKSYKEIGEQLGISEVAVYKNLHRAIEVLRQKISKYE